MEKILVQDECAPDSFETFNNEMKKLLNLTVTEFKESSTYENKDDFTLSWDNGRYKLVISADDKFYRLYDKGEDYANKSKKSKH